MNGLYHFASIYHTVGLKKSYLYLKAETGCPYFFSNFQPKCSHVFIIFKMKASLLNFLFRIPFHSSNLPEFMVNLDQNKQSWNKTVLLCNTVKSGKTV